MATLADVRKEFIQISRRYDLINNGDINANVDNGANAWIKRGQKFLDLAIQHPKQTKRQMEVLAAGTFSLTMTQLVSVDRLWVLNTGNQDRNEITSNFKPPDDFRADHPDFISAWDTGEPNDWTLMPVGLAPDQNDDTSGTFTSAGVQDFDDIIFPSATEPDEWKLLFFPKTDGIYTVDVWGRFGEPFLVNDTDTNYWTTQYDDLLALASGFVLERRLGDISRLRFYREAMTDEMNLIDNLMINREMMGRRNVHGEPFRATST
ncbi:MAG: hypothetical protein ACXABY_10740 [Candidatus Thorarchaeota archaeon]|jgi:hypothetical protein